MEKYRRPTWDQYFMEIAEAVAKRGTCDRGRTGVVIVKNKMILTTGYVGAPKGLPHCDDVGHLIKKMIHEDGRISQHCERTSHAEINAIALAAKHGISIDGATLYCLLEPCFTCAKMIVNAGIKRVVCKNRYHAGQETRKLFAEAGIKLNVLNNNVMKYNNQ
ncbi:MAG: cytidine/deoxycytidylate deaminase family protein [Nanoarchaeota archaeon]|nr:cytidine/deoxycytidylate deaminase family protein [Nanoarchaeota archaeon]